MNIDDIMSKALFRWIAEAKWEENGQRTDAYVHLYIRGITEGNTLSLKKCLKSDTLKKPFVSQLVAYKTARAFTERMHDDPFTIFGCAYDLDRKDDSITIWASVHLAEGDDDIEIAWDDGKREYIR